MLNMMSNTLFDPEHQVLLAQHNKLL